VIEFHILHKIMSECFKKYLYKKQTLFLMLMFFLISFGLLTKINYVNAFCGVDITIQSVTNITNDSATLNGNYGGSVGCTVDNIEGFFDYGISSGVYANTCSSGMSGPGTFSCDLTGLNSGTEYFFTPYIYGYDAVNTYDGSHYAYFYSGNEDSFTTLTVTTDDFVITVKTDNAGPSSDTQFIIPTSTASYDYNVDCDNDGTNEAIAQTGDYTCNYGSAGTYTIRIKDNTGSKIGFPRIYFNNTGDSQKILSVNQWGTGHWTSMENAFHGCINLNSATVVNNGGGAVPAWATDDPDLYSVTNMSQTFYQASAFNQSIGSWNTSNVINMNAMFNSASAFNQDLSGLELDSIVDSGVATGLRSMLDNSGLSTVNYDATLTGWNNNVDTPSTLTLGASTLTYCTSEVDRNNLIGAKGWTINSDSKNCPVVTPTVITEVVTSINFTSAMGSGNITDTGNENPERFIQWGG